MKIAAAKKNKKGFTLVELVIVIAVLAILAAIAVPNVTNVITQANESTDKSNAQTIELALKSAYAEAAAGTWKTSDGTAIEPSTLQVDTALSHEGLGSIDDMNKTVKETDLQFVYDTSGRITCGKENSKATLPTTNIKKDDAVKTVINAQ
jgi:prepilin-type N-terminal cleavage/methylation domain-containing protein